MVSPHSQPFLMICFVEIIHCLDRAKWHVCVCGRWSGVGGVRDLSSPQAESLSLSFRMKFQALKMLS